MGSPLSLLSPHELTCLIISLSVDIIEYIIPILMIGIIGTFYGLIGLATSLYLYKGVGAISALDIIPGLDILPMNTITWVVWIVLKRQKEAAERQIK
ncbi:hypothetical protein MUP77_02385 [Candidatus Bathyarchaeota archaeon]|nr:hypothetical protein [Candidatus Bathyarchaeota archaeon]